MIKAKKYMKGTSSSFKQISKFNTYFSKNFAEIDKNYNIELPQWKTIDLDAKLLPTSAKTTHKELSNFFELMTTMRYMEVQCNKLYMEQLIRGFLHVYVGEESVAVGMEAGITKEDCVITSYRDHGIAVVRGDTPYKIIAENTSKSTGSTHGKGGSMHIYSKKNNYYGGHGIVGAQISLGTGLAYALKYLNKNNTCITMFGDGASNQGQYYESINMAGLWNLPVVYLIENNHYGMGTSEERAHHYLPIMGKFRGFPALYCEGSNVFAVKEAVKFCKEYSIKNGPIILEVETYRYFGHSPSDPGVTYRKSEEVKERRAKKDCIDLVKKYLIKYNLATSEELDAKDKEISNKIKEDAEKAKQDPFPTKEDFLTHIYVEKDLPYVRGIEYKNSFFNEHKI